MALQKKEEFINKVLDDLSEAITKDELVARLKGYCF